MVYGFILTTLYGVKTMSKKSRSRNNQRSDAKNPNNPAYKDSEDNRSRQLNPEDEEYEKSRADQEKEDES